jgi:hypothetical protein
MMFFSEEFVSSPNHADVGKIGDRCFDEGLQNLIFCHCFVSYYIPLSCHAKFYALMGYRVHLNDDRNHANTEEATPLTGELAFSCV